MNWKEVVGDKITMIFGDDIHAGQYGMMLKVIETEIIEKLIEELPNHVNPHNKYLNMQSLKQQLRERWLDDGAPGDINPEDGNPQ